MSPSDRIKAVLIETLRNQGVSLAAEQPDTGIAFVGDGNGHKATVVLPDYPDNIGGKEAELTAAKELLAEVRALIANGIPVGIKTKPAPSPRQMVSSPELASIASRYMDHADENVRALAASVLAQAEVVVDAAPAVS